MRWTRQCMLVGIIGAVLTVVTALACGLWSPNGARVDASDESRRVLARRYPDVPSSSFVHTQGNVRDHRGRTVHMTHGVVASPTTSGNESLTVYRIELGWPSRALTGEYHFGSYLPRNHAYATRRVPNWAGNPERLLAFRPQLPGVLLDTVFFAVVAWLVGFGPGKIRGLLRGRRGACPRCGYPAGAADSCCECGSVISRHRRHREPD